MAEQKMLSVPEPQKVKLSELNFASYNPRVMPPDKMRALRRRSCSTASCSTSSSRRRG